MRETGYSYWFGACLGVTIGFGFNAILSWGTGIGRVNLILALAYFVFMIVVLIHKYKFAKRGKGE